MSEVSASRWFLSAVDWNWDEVLVNSRWKIQCWPKIPIFLGFQVFLCSAAVCRHDSGRCCSFLSYLAICLSQHTREQEIQKESKQANKIVFEFMSSKEVSGLLLKSWNFQNMRNIIVYEFMSWKKVSGLLLKSWNF